MRRMFSEKQIKELTLVAINGQDISPKDISASGKITGDEIVENMSGYSFNLTIDESYGTLSLDYAGVCKNGNKITFALAGIMNFSSLGISAGGVTLGTFGIPAEIGDKLKGTEIGNLNNLLSLNTALMYSENSQVVTGRGRFTKVYNDTIGVLLYSSGCSAETDYAFRFEATFLLSENLAPSGE